MKTMLQKVNASLKKNNKGFTLVELIIVIAIIAVLAAVIAPQYIKYVNSLQANNRCQRNE
jgi:type IV pilus assembly protein PilA